MRLYIRFLGLFCCFCLFSNLLSAQIRCARLANIGEGFPSDFVLGDKELSIRVMDKRSHSDIPFRKIDSIFITTLGKKIALTPMNADHIANYDYTDVVGDSAIIDIYSSEYGHGRYVYYKSIHRAPHFYSSITLYLSKEDYCPNELIVVGDRIELNLGKEKIGYDMGKLRQSKKEKWMKTLTRIPGLEIEEEVIKVNGKVLRHLFINGDYYFSEWQESYKDFMKQLKKSMK